MEANTPKVSSGAVKGTAEDKNLILKKAAEFLKRFQEDTE